MGGQCSHPPNSHESIQGKVDEWGKFEGRKTACYPSLLADKFASLIIPLLTGPAQDLEWNHRFTIQAKKQFADFPFLRRWWVLFSTPDWSRTDRQEQDHFGSLRKQWLKCIIDGRPDKIFMAHVGSDNADPPFLKKFCCHSARI